MVVSLSGRSGRRGEKGFKVVRGSAPKITPRGEDKIRLPCDRLIYAGYSIATGYEYNYLKQELVCTDIEKAQLHIDDKNNKTQCR